MPITTGSGQYYNSEFDLIADFLSLSEVNNPQADNSDKNRNKFLSSGGEGEEGLKSPSVENKEDTTSSSSAPVKITVTPKLPEISLHDLIGAGKTLYEYLRPEWSKPPELTDTEPGFVGKVPSVQIDPVLSSIGATMDLIGPITGGGSVAPKLAIFAGVGAKTLDKVALSKANLMLREGKSVDEVYRATGFYKGAEGRWRFEIPDIGTSLNTKYFDYVTDPSGVKPGQYVFKVDSTTLSKILDHPKLYEAYPMLRNLEVKRISGGGPSNSLGYYSPKDKSIYLAPESENPKHTLLHEIQHAIQDFEGFEFGANVESFYPKSFKQFLQTQAEKIYKLQDLIADTISLAYGYPTNEINKEVFDLYDKFRVSVQKYKDIIKDKGEANSFEHVPSNILVDVNEAKRLGIYDALSYIVDVENIAFSTHRKAFDMYRRVSGEVEAENVAQRYIYNQYNIPPMQTEAVPRSEQIPSPIRP